jgi:hypothetical protein
VGILVTVDSREQFLDGLVEAMVLLAKNPELRKKYGLAARRAAVSSMDWSLRTEQLLRIYREFAPELQCAPINPGGVNQVLSWPGPALGKNAIQDNE